MGVHLEVQGVQEVMQVKSRELQLENMEKLNTMIPIVETINDVDLVKIEGDTSEIKEIVSQNLEEQPNLEELLDGMDKLAKSISTLKGQLTKLTKKIDDLNESVGELSDG